MAINRSGTHYSTELERCRQRLQTAAAALDTTKAQRDEALLALKNAGASLRDIADASGLSHGGVAKILARYERIDAIDEANIQGWLKVSREVDTHG